MNVLLLGPRRLSVESCLAGLGDAITLEEGPLSAASLGHAEFLVSFGYRHRVPAKILEAYPKRAINVHISYLPWNRGADPNTWSFLEDTPKGVSIHYLSENFDAGELLCREELSFSPGETLRSTYDTLVRTGEELFCRHWPEIRSGRRASQRQESGGSFHRLSDLDPYRHLLKNGWDTPVDGLIGKAHERKARA